MSVLRGGKRRKDKRRKELIKRQGGRCNGCRQPLKGDDRTLDHIIPSSKSGNSSMANLQVLCSDCNRLKGSNSQEWLIKELERRRLASPYRRRRKRR